jgi:hypothetical protein
MYSHGNFTYSLKQYKKSWATFFLKKKVNMSSIICRLNKIRLNILYQKYGWYNLTEKASRGIERIERFVWIELSYIQLVYIIIFIYKLRCCHSIKIDLIILTSFTFSASQKVKPNPIFQIHMVLMLYCFWIHLCPKNRTKSCWMYQINKQHRICNHGFWKINITTDAQIDNKI